MLPKDVTCKAKILKILSKEKTFNLFKPGIYYVCDYCYWIVLFFPHVALPDRAKQEKNHLIHIHVVLKDMN